MPGRVDPATLDGGRDVRPAQEDGGQDAYAVRDALRQLEDSPGLGIEDGNSRANLYHWTHALADLGQVDRTVTADQPLHAVFVKGGRRSYVVWGAGPAAKPIEVRFSDGTRVLAGAPGPAVLTKEP